MIAVSRLDHVGVRVQDVSRTVSFYQHFGFGVIRDDRQEQVVVLRNEAGVELNLLDTANTLLSCSNVLMDQKNRYPGYTHIALQVEDIDATLQAVEVAGLKVTEGPVTFGDDKTSIFIRDPDRNVIELTQLAVKPESLYDREAGR